MTFVDTLRHWDKAVACADGKDISEALSIFLSIQEPNSKIYYNIGCLQLINQDFDAAEKAFDRSIGKDEHLAVAFFQRGITFYKKERFEECLDDFQYALKELKGNQLIDYKTLGLTYHLYACEVLHNMALARAQMGRWDKAQEHLVSALNLKTEVKLSLLDRALEATLKRKLFKLAEVPAKRLFKPNQKYVAELEKKDYLGKAKVVASVSPRGAGFSGFAPLQPQVEDSPVDPKPPETLRAFEGEPHMVLYEFVPQNSEELAVVPGNMVFMLHKGQDNWASVLFNGRTGLVPYNFLQPISLSSKQYQDLKNSASGAAPPQRREAPVGPAEKSPVALERKESPVALERKGNPVALERKGSPVALERKGNPVALERKGNPTTASTHHPGYTPDVKSERDAFEESAEPGESPLCTVKVFYTYTIAVSVSTGSPYATLVQEISRKLNVPAGSITLSLSSAENGQTVMDPNTDMEEVWSRASGGRITLRCEKKDQDQDLKEEEEETEEGQKKDQDLKEEENTDEQPAQQTQLVALHSYESPNPEDLQFNKGDTITLLSKVNEQWYEGRCHGNIGIFPASFVEEAPVGGQ